MTSLTFAITIPIGPSPSGWLSWTLRSLKAQEVKTRIAVCSVANSETLKDQLRPFSSQICYERFGPDKGQSEAINEGWQALCGDIYGWLNDDDCLAPDALTKVAKIFLDYPEVDVVFGDTILIENEAYSRLHPGPSDVDDTLYRDNLISQPSCFIRKSALFEVGLLDIDRHYTMDWDLWIRLYEAGKNFYYLPEVLSLVRHHADTKTGSLNIKRLSEIYKLVLRHSGLKNALHTGFNFCVFHLAEYGPFRGFFSWVKRKLCEPKTLHRNFKRDFSLFHYQKATAQKLVIDFEPAVNCGIYLDQKVSFQGETSRFEGKINLAPEEITKLQIEYKNVDTKIIQRIELT